MVPKFPLTIKFTHLHDIRHLRITVTSDEKCDWKLGVFCRKLVGNQETTDPPQILRYDEDTSILKIVFWDQRRLILCMQCPKLSFYLVHSEGALHIKLCTRKLLHAPSQYIAIINGSKNVHTPGAHFLKWPCKCARRVQP